MFKSIEAVESHQVWLFRCDRCGWHSDICHYPATQCLNCGNEIPNLHVLIGTSAEVGEYMVKVMK